MRGRCSWTSVKTKTHRLTPAYAGKIAVIKPISATSERRLCNLKHLLYTRPLCYRDRQVFVLRRRLPFCQWGIPLSLFSRRLRFQLRGGDSRCFQSASLRLRRRPVFFFASTYDMSYIYPHFFCIWNKRHSVKVGNAHTSCADLFLTEKFKMPETALNPELCENCLVIFRIPTAWQAEKPNRSPFRGPEIQVLKIPFQQYWTDFSFKIVLNSEFFT